MTDLTKASEALLHDAAAVMWPHPEYVTHCWLCVRLDAYAAAVRADTLADLAARLPEAFHAATCGCNKGPADYDRQRAAAILAHLGGTDR